MVPRLEVLLYFPLYGLSLCYQPQPEMNRDQMSVDVRGSISPALIWSIVLSLSDPLLEIRSFFFSFFLLSFPFFLFCFCFCVFWKPCLDLPERKGWAWERKIRMSGSEQRSWRENRKKRKERKVAVIFRGSKRLRIGEYTPKAVQKETPRFTSE
ncbi:hypothetical protein IE53DRAFT_74856 [Violaceomyces palustris]|uniref:Uncharacterized protein n=1 Tax=Violaceomyces palustris TaxID=1673888 RepID=A0ACD0NYT2_9BASI|nr:hypothetical protein IE53DRAFT_74856 [Violaceomyces palustris]